MNPDDFDPLRDATLPTWLRWLALCILGLLLGFVLAGLAGCAGAVPWNPQGYSGITKWDVEWCESKDPERDQYLCSVTVWDGKEKADVGIDVTRLADGQVVFSYSAKSVAAFEGQAIRGEAERAVTEAVRDALPGVVDTIMQEMRGPYAPPVSPW